MMKQQFSELEIDVRADIAGDTPIIETLDKC
jgi:hypothetical protein